MKIKYYVVSILFLILTITSVKAELPYETDQDHTFIVTAGKQWYETPYNKSAGLFTFNYNFNNKISFGISYRGFSTIVNNRADTNNSLVGIVHGDTEYYRKYIYLKSCYNLYAQINPMNLLHINSPVSFSLLGSYKLSSHDKTFIIAAYLYKKFEFSTRSSVQPTLIIGYKEFSYYTNVKEESYGAALNYSLSIHKKLDILIIPRVDYFLDNFNYTIQFGISNEL